MPGQSRASPGPARLAGSTTRSATCPRGCRCSIVHFEEVLARFPKEDRNDMRDENGIIRVDCAFCSREFLIED